MWEEVWRAPPLCYPDLMTGAARSEQSGAGRWSFWLSLLGGGAFCCALALLSLADRGEGREHRRVGVGDGLRPRDTGEPAPHRGGVVRLLQRRCRRLFALLGTAVSVAVLLVASYGFLWDLVAEAAGGLR